MCRLFGWLSPNETPAEDLLTQSAHSLLRLSDVNPEHLQDDGWGIGWFHAGTPVIRKGSYGAFRPAERSQFLSAAHDASGTLVVGHLRKASNPMNLPLERLHGSANSQPFSEDGLLFIHNGMIPLPAETRSRLGPYSQSPRGLNDSEVLFYLLLHNRSRSSDLREAYERSVKELTAVWEAQGRPGKGPYSGLNLIVATSPVELWAFCLYQGDHGTSLAGGKRPYYEMCFRERAGNLAVASEPLDGEPGLWMPLPAGTYLHAWIAHTKIMKETGGIHAKLGS